MVNKTYIKGVTFLEVTPFFYIHTLYFKLCQK
jgi:hypothetical protein